MAGDFWRVDQVPDAVASWVESEVVEAFAYYWTENPPTIYMPENPMLHEGVPMVVCYSHEHRGPDGSCISHEVSVNFLDELKEFACAYGDLAKRGAKLSDEQAADALTRAARLRGLAAQIAQLADEAEAIAKTA